MAQDIDLIKLMMLQNPNMSPEEKAQMQTMALLMGEESDEEVRGPILWDDAIAVGMVESRSGDPYPGTIGVMVEGAIAGKPTRLRITAQRAIDVRSARELKRIGSFFERVAEDAIAAYEEAKKKPAVGLPELTRFDSAPAAESKEAE